MIGSTILNPIFGIIQTRGGRESNGPATKHFAKLLSKARNRICIVSGGLSSTFYLSHLVKDALASAQQQGVTVEIIAGPNSNSDAIRWLRELGVSVQLLSSWPQQHFSIIDDRHVRVEEPHPQSMDERQCVQFIIYNYNYVHELIGKFNALKSMVGDK